MSTEKAKHSVDTEALQAVLNYLNSRPYGEVSTLVQGIMQSAVLIVQPVTTVEPVETEETKWSSI
jgi:hypothetical protein